MSEQPERSYYSVWPVSHQDLSAVYGCAVAVAERLGVCILQVAHLPHQPNVINTPQMGLSLEYLDADTYARFADELSAALADVLPEAQVWVYFFGRGQFSYGERHGRAQP